MTIFETFFSYRCICTIFVYLLQYVSFPNPVFCITFLYYSRFSLLIINIFEPSIKVFRISENISYIVHYYYAGKECTFLNSAKTATLPSIRLHTILSMLQSQSHSILHIHRTDTYNQNSIGSRNPQRPEPVRFRALWKGERRRNEEESIYEPGPIVYISGPC